MSSENRKNCSNWDKSKQKTCFFVSSVSLLGWLSLVSFRDISPTENWLGLCGTWFALFFRFSFGLMSYPILFSCFWSGTKNLINKTPIHIPHRRTRSISYVFFVCCCIVCSVLEEAQPKWFENTLHDLYTCGPNIQSSAGGFTASLFYKHIPFLNLKTLFSAQGTLFICAIVMVFCFLNFIDIIGKETVFKYLRHTFHTAKKICLSTTKAIRKTCKIINRIVSYIPTKKILSYILRSCISSIKLILSGALKLLKMILRIRTDQHHNTNNKSNITEKSNFFVIHCKRQRPDVVGITPQYTPTIHRPIYKQQREEIATVTSVVEKDIFVKPPLSVLQRPIARYEEHEDNLFIKEQSNLLQQTLTNFGIDASIVNINKGSTITSFEILPATGVKVQKITALENDIALNMQAKSIRIQAPIPGKAAVGIEVPSRNPTNVTLREILEDSQDCPYISEMVIPLFLGKTVCGENVICDLTKMPHLIVAGATGSGKSVCINAIITSILMYADPSHVKFIMIDPKKVELSGFSSIPHMIAPVITETSGVKDSLAWLVREMEWRYELFRRIGFRNISAFNSRNPSEEESEFAGIPVPEQLNYIVCIIDELADLMMSTSNSEIEGYITRIAQKARAVGIHIVLATQRPSREVITGLIKANFPSRIAFKVASRINSQIILDSTGAENLLGNGDMFFISPYIPTPIRAQGVLIRDEEIQLVVDFINQQSGPKYLIESFDNPTHNQFSCEGRPEDVLYDQAVKIILETGQASTTSLQRRLKIGYPRAASLIDEMEKRGIVGPQDGSKPRKILAEEQPVAWET